MGSPSERVPPLKLLGSGAVRHFDRGGNNFLQSYGMFGSHQMDLIIIGMVRQSQSYGMVYGMILVLTY